jgi:hypothetical protein
VPAQRLFPLTSASAAALSLLLLLGCALGYLNPNYALPSERRQRLSDAANRYVSFLRFGNVEMAAPFVEPRLRAEFISTFNGSSPSSVRFTDINVETIEFTERGRAVVLVQARLYRLPSVREVPLMEQQQWRYDPGARSWYVSPDFALYAGEGTPTRASPENFRP